MSIDKNFYRMRMAFIAFALAMAGPLMTKLAVLSKSHMWLAVTLTIIGFSLLAASVVFLILALIGPPTEQRRSILGMYHYPYRMPNQPPVQQSDLHCHCMNCMNANARASENARMVIIDAPIKAMNGGA